MKTLPRTEANVAWDQLWTSMKLEWFKVEVLQDYTGEDKGESLNIWMAGDRERSLEILRADNHEWADSCAKKVEQGIKLTRIHIVDYPLSEYLQWEIEVYKNRNIPIGHEEVYLLDRNDIAEVVIPKGDLMIFDQTNVVVGNYDETGYAATQTFYDVGDDISEFLMLRDKLLSSELVKV